MKTSRVATRLLLLALAFFSATTARATDLTGTVVFGFINTENPSEVVTTQFNSFAIVGPAVEFSGVMHDNSFNNDFTISADFAANSLTLLFTGGIPSANIFATPLFSLTFLDFPPSFTGFASTAYECDPSFGYYCPGVYNGLASETFAGSRLTLDFNHIANGERYIFSNSAPVPSNPAPVPEPATFALLGTGALSFVGALRRRFSPASSAL